jgi:PAS domain S-box-containing protein
MLQLIMHLINTVVTLPELQFSVMLNSESKQFEALFDYATIGIIVTDKEGRIINFNKKAEQDFGYMKEELLGHPVEMLLPASRAAKHAHYRNGYYQHPSPRAMGAGRDLFGKRKDGTVFPVEVSLSNYTADGNLFVIAFVIDITVRKDIESAKQQQQEELSKITVEVKRLNASLEKKVEDRTKMLREALSALEQSKEELSEALQAEKSLNELKSRFVSMASHEFKTPLSTILSSAFLLEKYNEMPEPAKREKHIERIKNAVNDMKDILGDFLSLDKLDEGLMQSNIHLVAAADLIQLIATTVSEMEVTMKRGQQIIFAHEGNSDARIDRLLMKNIIINLLSNAIKFSAENTNININAIFGKDGFTLSVQDRGIGISEEDRQHLFERFFRAKNAFNIQGTGLGLHIITRYLELMHGTIRLESELDKGSVFTIFIPD